MTHRGCRSIHHRKPFALADRRSLLSCGRDRLVGHPLAVVPFGPGFRRTWRHRQWLRPRRTLRTDAPSGLMKFSVSESSALSRASMASSIWPWDGAQAALQSPFRPAFCGESSAVQQHSTKTADLASSMDGESQNKWNCARTDCHRTDPGNVTKRVRLNSYGHVCFHQIARHLFRSAGTGFTAHHHWIETSVAKNKEYALFRLRDHFPGAITIALC